MMGANPRGARSGCAGGGAHSTHKGSFGKDPLATRTSLSDRPGTVALSLPTSVRCGAGSFIAAGFVHYARKGDGWRWLCQVTLLHRAPSLRPHHPPSITASRLPLPALHLPLSTNFPAPPRPRVSTDAVKRPQPVTEPDLLALRMTSRMHTPGRRPRSRCNHRSP